MEFFINDYQEGCLPEIIEKRFNIVIGIIVIAFTIIGGRLFYLQVLKVAYLCHY